MVKNHEFEIEFIVQSKLKNTGLSMWLMWSEIGYADTWNCLYIKHNYVYRVSKKIELKVKSCKC